MGRNKQKKKNGPPAARNVPSEDGKGRGNGGCVVREPEGSFVEAGAEGSRLRGCQKDYQRTVGKALTKYQKRYDDLVEMVSGACLTKSSTSRSPSARIVTDHNPSDNEGVTMNFGTKSYQAGSSLGSNAYGAVLFTYEDIDGKDKTCTSQNVYRPDMEICSNVVLPASEARAEVVLDRRRGSKVILKDSWSELDFVNTLGLGFVNDKLPGDAVEDVLDDVLCKGPEVQHIEFDVGAKPKTVLKGDDLCHATEPSARLCATDCGLDKLDLKRPGNDGYLKIGGVKIFTLDMRTSRYGDDQNSRNMQKDLQDMDNNEKYGCRDWVMKFKSKKKSNRLSRRARFHQTFNPYEARHSSVDSSEEDDASLNSDSDICDELVDDYLANCEGLSVDLNDPLWVQKYDSSMKQVPVEDMPLQEMENDSSRMSFLEGLNGSETDSESSASSTSCYETRKFGTRVAMKRRNEKPTVDDGFDSDLSHLAEFSLGSDCAVSCTKVGKLVADFSALDDETCTSDSEQDEAVKICYLEPKGDTGNAIEIDRLLLSRRRRKSLGKRGLGSYKRSEAVDEGVGSDFVSPIRTKDIQDMESRAFQTWPVSRGGRRIMKGKGLPGQKKKERRESIATKRRERALQRGFDLNAVSKALEDMVLKKKDCFAFEPMKQQDRAQVHRVASLYGLKSGSQGSTKRRFVVVSCTRYTRMPSGDDKVRLLKLLGKSETPTRPDSNNSMHRVLTGDERRMFVKTRRAALQALQGLQNPSSARKEKGQVFEYTQGKSCHTGKDRAQRHGYNGAKSSITTKTSHTQMVGDRSVRYAHNPVSFTAKGLMVVEDALLASGKSSFGTFYSKETLAAGSARISKSPTLSKPDFANFEAHTKGFGSKMMAKMGFTEGLGLGRDKQGIAEPVEVFKRPKSLGLGALV